MQQHSMRACVTYRSRGLLSTGLSACPCCSSCDMTAESACASHGHATGLMLTNETLARYPTSSLSTSSAQSPSIMVNLNVGALFKWAEWRHTRNAHASEAAPRVHVRHGEAAPRGGSGNILLHAVIEIRSGGLRAQSCNDCRADSVEKIIIGDYCTAHRPSPTTHRAQPWSGRLGVSRDHGAASSGAAKKR